MLKKSTLREIIQSFSRWLAILAIVALGVGFFCGLKVCREAFWTTGDEYFTSRNMFDFELISTLGIEQKNVDEIKAIDGVEYAEGSYSKDALFSLSDTQDDNEESEAELIDDIEEQEQSDEEEFQSEGMGIGQKVGKFHMITQNINTLKLVEGSMPQAADECIVDANRYTSDDIGKYIVISSDNDKDTNDIFKYKAYHIVGRAESPLYLNFERGSTSLGNGSVNSFIYIPEDGWDSEVYTEMYVTLDQKYDIYSDEYDDLIDEYEDIITESFDATAVSRYDSILKEANDKLDEAQKKLDDAKAELEDYEKELEDGKEKIAASVLELKDASEEIRENEARLEESRISLQNAEGELAQAKAQIESNETTLEASKAYMTDEQYLGSRAEIDAALEAWNAQNEAYLEGLAELESGEEQLKKAQKELAKGEEQLLKARSDLATGEDKIADGKTQIEKNEKKLQKAIREVADIEEPDTYILGRETNIGYVCFENDTNIVDGIAKVFPVFFFLVAALVVMTTMTRMVSEQRTQIGVLKALGYSKLKIANKYLFYSVTAAIIGGVAGFVIGSYLFPWVIWEAYGMMYGFSELHFVLNYKLGGLSVLVAIICAAGSTLFSTMGELSEVPAELIRPKAPASGKRILLERIHFIWDKLPFLHKVSARNIFRYKKRFFMMVLGISGCTALLITGLGISDSIKNVVDAQYENVFKADYVVSFDHQLDSQERAEFMETNGEYAEDAMYLYTVSMDASKGDMIKSVNLVAIDESDMPDDMDKFVDLHTDEGEPLDYPGEGECIINSNLGIRLGLEVGDEITLRDGDMNEITAVIASECENFVYNYMYISGSTYEKCMQKSLEPNAAYVTGYEGADPNQDGAKLMNAENVTGVNITNDFRIRVSKMMKALDYVILLVIFSAGALAFIVLYNLTNINITERIREIATIKVLGFYPGETAQYVFRENVVLTFISCIAGIPVGWLLHHFVMSQVIIDLISFDVHIEPVSYVIAVVLTFVFAVIVNIFMRFRLNRINMAESLKSIE